MTIKVKAEKCATCIFRPGNPMHLNPGRVKGMVEDCDRHDAHVICHETLDPVAMEEWGDQPYRPMSEGEAVCRGYMETGRRSQLLRVAERVNMIEEVA